MKLYLLRPVEGANEWEPWYDKAFGFIVRAETEERARELAAEEGGGETRGDENPWLISHKSTCVEVSADGNEEVIIRDFAAA